MEYARAAERLMCALLQAAIMSAAFRTAWDFSFGIRTCRRRWRSNLGRHMAAHIARLADRRAATGTKSTSLVDPDSEPRESNYTSFT